MEVPAGQGFCHARVHEDSLRLVEGAYGVLAAALVQVQGDFPADGAADLGQHGGGELDVGNTPVPGGGGEVGDIAYHAAPQGDEYVAGTKAEVRQGAVDFIDEMEIPGFFTGRYHDHLGPNACVFQGLHEPRAIEPVDTVFRDDGGLRSPRQVPDGRPRPAYQSVIDEDVVRIAAKINMNLIHIRITSSK